MSPKIASNAQDARSDGSLVWETLEAHMRTQLQARLQELMEEEVTAFLGRAKSVRRGDAAGGYRNGHGKARAVSLLGGTVRVRRPRVRGLEDRFVSQLVPFFQKQTPAVTALLHQGYLHGMAMGDFSLALRELLGDGAPLSAASLCRLTTRWNAAYQQWRARSLADVELVYLWADGIYVKAGVDTGKAALLVLIGALRDGTKVVLAVESGARESTESWATVLRDLHARGLRAPRLTIGDGNLGLWGALAAVYPESAEQRCWVHKLRNVLDQVPKAVQPEVLGALREVMYATTRATAERLRRRFATRYARWPKAVAALERDWMRLTTFFAFPGEHWIHLRTTNIIESPFAAVRLRTSAAKRFKRVDHATALIWKLLLVAERSFRTLTAPDRCAAVGRGLTFIDGKPAEEDATEKTAA